jgi:pimeloyl-ACP methyl ester carboxylesterase
MLRRALLLALLAAAAMPACGGDLPDPPPGATSVSIVTADGEFLDAVDLGRGDDVAVLSHGVNGTKEDFYPMASALADAGWRVIAYDARGVGESTGSRGEHRDVDLRAVVGHARSASPGALLLVGGSLGASLSLSMATELEATAVVSLSASASTFGALEAARSIGATIPVFVAAAQDDEPYSQDAVAIAEALGTDAEIVSGNGHGTGMFLDHPDLIEAVVAFAADSRA